jgi:hypothetical protein
MIRNRVPRNDGCKGNGIAFGAALFEFVPAIAPCEVNRVANRNDPIVLRGASA